MVKHVVMFRMNGTREERLDACRRFAEDLKELPGKIEVLESIEVGINENPSEEWDLVLTAVVPTLSDVSVYAKHPDHVAAASAASAHIAARACVDYNF